VGIGEIAEKEEAKDYRSLMFAHGQIPVEAPDKEFIAEKDPLADEIDEDFDFDDYDDTDFDENWN
jgi:hypothetical protein